MEFLGMRRAGGHFRIPHNVLAMASQIHRVSLAIAPHELIAVCNEFPREVPGKLDKRVDELRAHVRLNFVKHFSAIVFARVPGSSDEVRMTHANIRHIQDL